MRKKKVKQQISEWTELKISSWENLFKHADLEWNDLQLSADGGVVLKFQYPLNSRFFLESAKRDLKEGDARGRINALSNAKRAIDCQTDSFLSAIGYSPKKLDKQIDWRSSEELKAFVKNRNRPLKFQILESLGIVTPQIVTRVRSIRNLLEHEYKKPSLRDSKDAIDIASLYVRACQGEMNAFLEEVSLGYGRAKHPLGEEVPQRSITIALEDDSPIHLELTYWDFKNKEKTRLQVSPGDAGYLGLIRILFTVRSGQGIEEAISFIANKTGAHVTPEEVRVEEDFVRIFQ